MEHEGLRHRLAAVLAADAVGYSRLMSIDERATVHALDRARAVFTAAILGHQGRLVDTAGDSVLAVFDTAAGAAKAAIAIQARLEPEARAASIDSRMQFRIGLHLGDLFEKEDGSVYGDGVNIAARLQALAEPGGIVASESLMTAIAGRVPAGFDDLGVQTVKNIARPVRAYAIVGLKRGRWLARRPFWIGASARKRSAYLLIALVLIGAVTTGWYERRRGWSGVGIASLFGKDPAEVSTRPTIAVLAFANLSEDKGTEYFSDGVSEELLNTLGLVPGLTVIGRTSSFQFKNREVSISEIGQRLGASYVVEGSVRKASERVRITVRLARAADGATLWSNSYDRALQDVLGVQTEMALVIAQKLQLQISRAELAESNASNAEAQLLVFESAQAIFEHTKASYTRAETLLVRALVLDPNYAKAKAVLINVWWNQLRDDHKLTFANRNSPEFLRIAGKVDELLASAPSLSDSYAVDALVRFSNWDSAEADRAVRHAIELNPNNVSAHIYHSVQLEAEGFMTEALEELKWVVDVDPLAARRSALYAGLLMQAGRPSQALPFVDRAAAIDPGAPYLAGLRAKILVDLGRHRDANEILMRMMDANGGKFRGGFPWDAYARAGGQKAREAIEDYLKGPASQPGTGANPNFRRVRPLLALDRPVEALQAISDETDFQREDFPDLVFWDPAWDPVRSLPRFQAILEKLGMTEAHARAQAWRAANPPEVVARHD